MRARRTSGAAKRVSCERNPATVSSNAWYSAEQAGHVLRGTLPTPRIRAVSHDGEEPRALVAAVKTAEISPSAQIRLLHDVLRVVLIAKEMSRKRIRVVEQGHDGLLEAIQNAVAHKCLVQTSTASRIIE